jgi:mannose-1-phosphate guanylyltransferase
MELLERYIKEIEEDLKIDEFNIKEVGLRIPARKHFWVSRLINHKRNLLKLENDKNFFKKTVMTELQTQSPVKLSLITAENAAENHDKMREMNIKIGEEKIIIEFLEKTEKTFSSMTYDVSNIIKIMQLEQL